MQPKQYDGMDCLTDCLLSVVYWLKGDFTKAFQNAWNFHYEMEDRKKIYNRIYLSDNVLINVERLYGIRIVEHVNLTTEHAEQLIKEELSKNKPVVVRCLATWCYWGLGYKKGGQGQHAYIIVKKHRKYYHCMDALPEILTELKVPKEEFQKGLISIFTYETVPTIKEEPKNWKEVLKESVSDPISGKCSIRFAEMNTFIDDFSKVDFAKILNEEEYYWDTKIFRTIKHLKGTRDLYYIFFEWATREQADQLKEWYQKFEELKTEWNIIQSLVIKAGRVPKSVLRIQELIVNHLRIVSQIEQEFAQDFFGKLDSESNEIPKPRIPDRESEVYEIVNVKQYYNSDDMFTKNDGLNYQIPFPLGYIFKDKNMQFDFPIEDEYTTVLTSGEEISIKPRNYIAFAFAGYAIWGTQEVHFDLIYEDGTEEQANLIVNDWRSDPDPTVVTIWSSECKVKDSGEKFMVSVSGYRYEIKKTDSKICKVRLPMCDKLFLYAVTFIAKE